MTSGPIRSLALALACLSPIAANPASAQDAQDPMQARLDQKLAEPWVSRAPWVKDFDTAKAQAAARGVPIFAYFTRSYAH